MTCVRSPTREGRITSGYGMRPGRTTGQTRLHAGLDMRGAPGDPVFAAQAGTVETVVSDGGRVQSVFTRPPPARAFNGYGNVVVVKHVDGTWGSYNHLSGIAVRAGQSVDAGELIGAVGNTSNGKFPGMGAHLHFEVRHAVPGVRSPFPSRYGVYNVDPARWMRVLGARVDAGRVAVPSVACDIAAVAMRATTPSAFAAFDEVWPEIDWVAVKRGQVAAREGEEYEPPRSDYSAPILLMAGLATFVVVAWAVSE